MTTDQRILSASDFLSAAPEIVQPIQQPSGALEFLGLPPQQPAGFIERVGERAGEREAAIQELSRRQAAGEITPVTGAIGRTLGEAGGFLGDIAGEALVSAGRGISAITPEPIKEAIGGVAEATREQIASAVQESPAIQSALEAIASTGQGFEEFKQDNPTAARVLEEAGIIGQGALNLALLTFPAARAPSVGVREVTEAVGEQIGKAGAVISAVGEKQIFQKKSDFAKSLIAPRETAKEIEQAAQAGRVTEQGIFRQRVIAPTARETEISSIVEKLNVTPKRSFAHNNGVIIDGIDTRAKKLASDLDKTKVIFPRTEIKARVKANTDNLLQNNPFLVGNSELTAQRVFNIAEETIDRNPSTAAGLFKARKEFDQELRRQTVTASGKTVFDTDADKAITIAIRDLRGTINDFIAEKAPNVRVKESLKQQELLFSARDNVASKIAREGADSRSRLIQKISEKLPKGEGARVATLLAGAGLTGGAAITAPGALAAGAVIGGAALGGRQAVRAVTSGQTKKALGGLLKATNKVIKLEKETKALNVLKADRLILIETIDRLTKEEQS